MPSMPPPSITPAIADAAADVYYHAFLLSAYCRFSRWPAERLRHFDMLMPLIVAAYTLLRFC